MGKRQYTNFTRFITATNSNERFGRISSKYKYYTYIFWVKFILINLFGNLG